MLGRFPDLRVVVPHAGAVLPLLADRVHAFAGLLAPDVDVLEALSRLHYDVAGYTMDRQLDALLSMTTRDHLHYGSDWPFTPEEVVVAAAEGVGGLADELATNAEGLFRRGHA